jgi:hypothetical protein
LPQLDEQRFMEILDSYGAPVFREIFKYAREQAMHVQWGSKGFSLNVECDGTRVVLVLGYVPSAVYGQSVYTALYRPGGLVAKAGVDDISVQNLASEARATGLFTAAGRELKCVVDRRVSDREIAGLVAWIGKAVDSVRERGFSEGDSDGPQPSAETDTQQQHSADDAARRG